MHGDHEPSGFRGGDFGLIHGNGGDQGTDAKAVDQSSNEEHSIIDRARTDSRADHKNHSRDLDRPLPSELVCKVGTDRAANS